LPAAAEFHAVEILPGGLQIGIRALRPEDREHMMSAVQRISGQSLYRRFFGPKRHFTERELSFFLNVDFSKHVALVAVVRENEQEAIIGGGRYVVSKSGQAEIAFAVVDEYQGRGIGNALLRHLVTIARQAGLRELVAEVLSENQPMLKVFEKSGLPIRRTHEGRIVHVALALV
jgi:RimJ/RimL family protein N-acetyltransferase